jgi:hypothetical protein
MMLPFRSAGLSKPIIRPTFPTSHAIRKSTRTNRVRSVDGSVIACGCIWSGFRLASAIVERVDKSLVRLRPNSHSQKARSATVMWVTSRIAPIPSSPHPNGARAYLRECPANGWSNPSARQQQTANRIMRLAVGARSHATTFPPSNGSRYPSSVRRKSRPLPFASLRAVHSYLNL